MYMGRELLQVNKTANLKRSEQGNSYEEVTQLRKIITKEKH